MRLAFCNLLSVRLPNVQDLEGKRKGYIRFHGVFFYLSGKIHFIRPLNL
uniref:Uncharacterized protein n=1 Tax=Arundo donax TaxID=35708 RepID=A0A0A9FKJ8_ARUDO